MKIVPTLILIVSALITPARAEPCTTEARDKEGIIRELLSDVAKRGLRGKHHYSITFKTDAEGVRIPAKVAAQYPDETTIILQYQFEHLKVAPDRFEVELAFAGKWSLVVVPYSAITLFIDPSVNARISFDPSARRGQSCRNTYYQRQRLA